MLRIYIRDQASAYIEQNVGNLLFPNVRAPLILYIGKHGDYPFAVMEYISGITLSNFLLGDFSENTNDIMYEVGEVLSRITEYTFPKAGFFNSNLVVTESDIEKKYTDFAEACLKDKIIASRLEEDLALRIAYYLNKYRHLLNDIHGNNLVHGDFDPSNILVDKLDGVWKITGILDWEFAFSGSLLHDIANMLRYSHKMPSEYTNSFLAGLTDKGAILPRNWGIIIKLLNIFSLVDCLRRSCPKSTPNRCNDIYNLINYFLLELDKI